MADGLPALASSRRLGRDQNHGFDHRTAEVLGGMIGGALVGTFLGVPASTMPLQT